MIDMLYELIDTALPPSRVQRIRAVLLALALLACVGSATALAANMVAAASHHHAAAPLHKADGVRKKVE